MSTTHVYFADMPLAAAGPEGHTSLDVLNDDVIRQCRSISPNCNSSNSPIPRYERNMGFFRQLSRRFGLRSNDDLVFSNSNEDDTQSSSTDSCSSSATTAAISANIANAGDNNRRDNNQRCSSTANSEYISCASSETSSTVDIEEQLQQLQQQHQRQQQQQQNLSNTNDSCDNIDVAEADAEAEAEHNNENMDDVDKRLTYNKERKSFARSSFSRLHRRSTTSLRRAFEAFSLSSRSLSCSGATPPTNQPTSSSSTTTTTNNGTPIKSALKSCSNLELNKYTTAAATSCLKKSSCSSSAVKSTSTTTTTSTTSSSSKNKSKPPQRILRQPVSYTYLKGISGLPTQRVPRNSVCCQYARR
ncbi:uncharacterized protein ACRADG_001591 [Cochliomyia hominivorax]